MKLKYIAITLLGIMLALSFFVFIIVNLLSFFTPETSINIIPNITPSSQRSDLSPRPNAPKSTLLLPTVPVDSGGGIDISAPPIEISINEIKKIELLLPYSRQITLSTGLTVDIIISPTSGRPWVLPVFIGGIDYNVPNNASDYVLMRSSFREGAQFALNWLSENGVDTSAIFVNWGDRTFVQDRAELWLQ